MSRVCRLVTVHRTSNSFPLSDGHSGSSSRAHRPLSLFPFPSPSLSSRPRRHGSSFNPYYLSPGHRMLMQPSSITPSLVCVLLALPFPFPRRSSMLHAVTPSTFKLFAPCACPDRETAHISVDGKTGNVLCSLDFGRKFALPSPPAVLQSCGRSPVLINSHTQSVEREAFSFTPTAR